MKKIKYSFEDWCKDNDRQDLLNLWDYDLNNTSPSNVSAKTDDKYWFKCSRGLHKSTERRLSSMRHNSKILCRECNTFGFWLLDNLGADAVNKYWSDKNEYSPFDIQKTGTTHIWAKHIDVRYPDYWISVRNFIKQQGIPKYNRRIVVRGVNDIATTHPEYVPYFLNTEDAYNHSHGCTAFIDVVCPICGHIRNVRIDRLTSSPFSCPVCGDGVSYPNKFVREFLNQLRNKSKVVFESEKVFDWSKNLNDKRSKRTYDFYLSLPIHMIIEAHGAQHYDSSFSSMPGARTLDEEKNNDAFKYDLAIKNGFTSSNYIILDCRKSSLEWIKNSIMGSQLPTIFNFTEFDIDWEKCNQIATSNYIWLAAELWSGGLRNTRFIAEQMQLNPFTIERYLKRARELNWCDYDAKLVRTLGQRQPIICVDNGVAFASVAVCEEFSENVFGKMLKASAIKSAIQKGVEAYGLLFYRITQQEFLDYKIQHSHMAFGDVYLTL